MPLFIPLLLTTIGTYANAPSGTVSQLPPEILDRNNPEAKRRQQSNAVQGPAYGAPNGSGCTDEMSASPAVGAMAAQKALDRAQGEERVRAGLCLGVALGSMGRWDEARNAFIQARDAAAPADSASRARLGAMGGNAALAAGAAATALPILEAAQADAKVAQDTDLGSSIAIDRARALVALGQKAQAAAALAEARSATPDNAQAWLLSATLARRENKLAEAQGEIEKAAQLAPEDPEIGLEAGVIAVLGGRDDAARKSWQSVVSLAPSSDAAVTAKGYLAQLDPGVAKP